MNKQLLWRNITISGGVASGKNTLLDNLKPFLEPLGWKFSSGGKILRDYLKEYKHPLASLGDEKIHHIIDERNVKLLQEGNYVIESWLAGFMARNFNDTLRILLICSNPALKIDRVVNRDKVTVDQAKQMIKEREEDNIKTWKKLYGDYEFFDPKYYHLVIDTFSSGPLETVGKVLDRLGFKNKKL